MIIRTMVINMNETRLQTIEQIEDFLSASAGIEFSAAGSDDERSFSWIMAVVGAAFRDNRHDDMRLLCVRNPSTPSSCVKNSPPNHVTPLTRGIGDKFVMEYAGKTVKATAARLGLLLTQREILCLFEGRPSTIVTDLRGLLGKAFGRSSTLVAGMM